LDQSLLGERYIDTIQLKKLPFLLLLNALGAICGTLGGAGDQGHKLAEPSAKFIDMAILDLDKPVGLDFLWETIPVEL
jgi:hypothetical protein